MVELKQYYFPLCDFQRFWRHLLSRKHERICTVLTSANMCNCLHGKGYRREGGREINTERIMNKQMLPYIWCTLSQAQQYLHRSMTMDHHTLLLAHQRHILAGKSAPGRKQLWCNLAPRALKGRWPQSQTAAGQGQSNKRPAGRTTAWDQYCFMRIFFKDPYAKSLGDGGAE